MSEKIYNFRSLDLTVLIKLVQDVRAVINNTTEFGDAIGLSTLVTRLREYGWFNIPGDRSQVVDQLVDTLTEDMTVHLHSGNKVTITFDRSKLPAVTRELYRHAARAHVNIESNITCGNRLVCRNSDFDGGAS